jgi:hypothetical protein
MGSSYASLFEHEQEIIPMQTLTVQEVNQLIKLRLFDLSMCIEAGRSKWMLNHLQSLDKAEKELLQARKVAKRTLRRFAVKYPSIKWRLACEVLIAAFCRFILWLESQQDLQQLSTQYILEGWHLERIKQREDIEWLLMEPLAAELKKLGFEFEFDD